MENKKIRKITDDFFSSSIWLKLKNRLTYRSKKFNLSIEDTEDLISSYALNLIEGKSIHQTIDQFFIDYIRRKFGRSKSARKQKSMLANASRLEDVDYCIGKLDPKADTLPIAFLTDKQLNILNMIFYGYSYKEIGEIFKVSESRVCQMVSEIREDINYCYNFIEELTEVVDQLNINKECRKWIFRLYKEKGKLMFQKKTTGRQFHL